MTPCAKRVDQAKTALDCPLANAQQAILCAICDAGAIIPPVPQRNGACGAVIIEDQAGGTLEH